MLRKAAEAGLAVSEVQETDLRRLDADFEFEIARQLDGFADAITKAAADYEPFYLTRLLSSLARTFNKYYNSHSILSAGDPSFVLARLAVCESVSATIRTGMRLLGIAVPERM